MLRYLKILSWFLLTFGVFGFLFVSFGIDTGIGVGPQVLALMAFQMVIAALILGGFKRVKDGKLHPQVLTAAAIALILFYVVAGQIWMSLTKPERGANATVEEPRS